MIPQAAIDAYLRHLAVERGLSENTLRAYGRDLAGYAEWLAARGVTRIEDVDAALLADHLRSLRERAEAPLAASSQARVLSSVRGLHRFLADEGVASADPGATLKPPKLGMRLPKALTIAEVQRMLDATSGEEPGQLRDRALLELLYATGARVSELTALDVDDLGEENLLRVRGKGGKQRIVPFGAYARTALDAYLVRARPLFSVRGPATPALFLGARGARVSRQNAWLVIRAAAERAGIEKDVSPHTMRHSFATHLLQGGADVRVVQELLGHASVATTQIYTLVTADSLRDVYLTSHPRAR